MEKTSLPAFATITSLARRAGVHRSVAMRVTAQGLITADALLDGDPRQPMFLLARAADVIRFAHPSKRPLVGSGVASATPQTSTSKTEAA